MQWEIGKKYKLLCDVDESKAGDVFMLLLQAGDDYVFDDIERAETATFTFESHENPWEWFAPVDDECHGSSVLNHATPAHHPCATGHRPEHWVNVGFYTATYACKHCGCDKFEEKRLIDVDDLTPGEELVMKKTFDWVQAGTKVTVLARDDFQLKVQIHAVAPWGPGAQYLNIQHDVINEYLEYPND